MRDSSDSPPGNSYGLKDKLPLQFRITQTHSCDQRFTDACDNLGSINELFFVDSIHCMQCEWKALCWQQTVIVISC